MKVAFDTVKSWVGAALAGIAFAGCASSSGAGSETHFACTRDTDCNSRSTCIDGHCVARSSEPDAGTPGKVPKDGGKPVGPVRETGMPSLPGCAAVSSSPLWRSVTDEPTFGTATFTSTGDGFVGVWPTRKGTGYQVSLAPPNAGGSQTIWPSTFSSGGPSIAVRSGTLALVDQAPEGAGARQTCRLGLMGYPSLSSIREPSRYSDPPDDATIRNEAFDCHVAATDRDFAVVFREHTSSTSLAWSLFLEHYGADGRRIGNRTTLATGDEDKDKVDGVSITSAGPGLAVAYGHGTGVVVKLVFNDTIQSVDVPLAGAPRITFAHSQLLVTTADQGMTLDVQGRRIAGPVALPGAEVAPLGDGWVAVSHEEYLVARALDEDFTPSSPPAGLSDDRSATATGLVYAPDGSATRVAYTDTAGPHIDVLSCTSNVGPPPGPAACPTSSVVDSLDDGCTDAVCHLAIRLDYLTLAPRGWASVGAPALAVDSATARSTATSLFKANCMYCGSEVTVTDANAGLYRVFATPSDFGAFALVGEQSGAVVTAGGVAWAGRGSYFVPTTWKSAADIRCGMSQAVPKERFFDSSGCDTFDGKAGASSDDALAVALRTNLAQSYSPKGPFSAYVYLYTPTVGGCEPSVAEYVVVLTRMP